MDVLAPLVLALLVRADVRAEIGDLKTYLDWLLDSTTSMQQISPVRRWITFRNGLSSRFAASSSSFRFFIVVLFSLNSDCCAGVLSSLVKTPLKFSALWWLVALRTLTWSLWLWRETWIILFLDIGFLLDLKRRMFLIWVSSSPTAEKNEPMASLSLTWVDSSMPMTMTFDSRSCRFL